MSDKSYAAPCSTFVVRLWREWTVEGPRWRGRIEHLQSGECGAFVDADGLLGFMRGFVHIEAAWEDGGSTVSDLD